MTTKYGVIGVLVRGAAVAAVAARVGTSGEDGTLILVVDCYRLSVAFVFVIVLLLFCCCHCRSIISILSVDTIDICHLSIVTVTVTVTVAVTDR